MRWWRRNAVGLVAAAVLLPSVGLLSFSDGWREHRDSLPTQPVRAVAGAPVTFAGAEWRLTGFDRHAAEDLDEPLPDGSALVVVGYRVEAVEGGERPEGCRIQLRLDEQTWHQPDPGEIGWSPADGYEYGCTPDDDRTRLDGQAAFVLPADQVEAVLSRGEIMVVLSTELPRYLSLRH